MKLPLRSRIAAWLCLALVVLAGLTPAQGFVVCVEADGCVSVELKPTNADCGGCEGHEADDSSIRVGDSAGDGSDCPCIDVAVPGSPEELLAQSRATWIDVGPWIAPAPEPRVRPATPQADAGRAPPLHAPRVADSLAHHRSVVLLV